MSYSPFGEGFCEGLKVAMFGGKENAGHVGVQKVTKMWWKLYLGKGEDVMPISSGTACTSSSLFKLGSRAANSI